MGSTSNVDRGHAGGHAIPSHALNAFSVRDSFVENALPGSTHYLQRIEVPCGCGLAVTMVFTYPAPEFRHSKSGWWAVAYTQLATKVGAFLLVEVYDNYRLWCTSSEMIRNICGLDLEWLLGSCTNAEDLYHLLRLIDHRISPDFWMTDHAEGRGVVSNPGVVVVVGG